MQTYTNATRALLEQTKNSNPTAGAMGALTGELIKGAAGYMTFGKAAEDAVLKKAEKLTSMKEKAIAGLLAQQAADTAVNTPITIAAGLADGKSRKEISEGVGKQMAVDAAMNVGFEAVGAGVKVLRLSRLDRKAAENVLKYYGITDIHSSSNVVNGVMGRIKDTFLSTSKNVKPILNEETGLNVEIWKRGIDETFRKARYYPALSDDMKVAKIASIEQLPELIRTGTVRSPERSNYHDPTSKARYVYLQNETNILGKKYVVTLDIQKLPDQTNRFYIHDIKIKEATNAQRDSSLSGPPSSGKQSVASDKIITDTENNVKMELQQLALQAHKARKNK